MTRTATRSIVPRGFMAIRLALSAFTGLLFGSIIYETYLPSASALSEPMPWLVGLSAGAVFMAVSRPRPTKSSARRLDSGALLAVSPSEFEEAIADLFSDLGYTSVVRTGGSGDLAADIVAVDSAGRTVVIQCKRYASNRKVGSSALQMFVGMAKVHHKSDRAIFVTTSTFTPAARELAAEHEIVLYDAESLADLMSRATRSGRRRAAHGIPERRTSSRATEPVPDD